MKNLLVIAFVLLFAQLQAQVKIEETEARASAERFIKQQGKVNVRALTLNEEIKSKQSGQTNLYVFSIEPKGFVIVSALGDILAYSLVSNMPSSNTLPDHITYWLNLYNAQTDYLIEHPQQRRKPNRSKKEVGPLLTSVWGQGCYFNEACPYDTSGYCQHSPAGCVPIAMAQIMYYHKRPLNGNGSLAYSCPPYGTLSADFGNTSYLWEKMCDTLHESNPAVAALVSHCGISAKTHYGTHSSSASSIDAANAFIRYFYYPNATLLRRSHCSDEEWINSIKEDLDNSIPIYYVGYSSDVGGHAFVCDGYDSQGFFHFNFGWNGNADGYFTINSPSGHAFSYNQTIIHHLYPAPVINIYIKEEICEGQNYNFFGRQLNKEGHYYTYNNNKLHELELIVNSLPDLHCNNDTIVEYGHPLTLNAFGADNYLWSTGDTTDCITIIPEKDITYSVIGYNALGCSKKVWVKVQVSHKNAGEIILFPNPANDKVTINSYLIDAVEILDLYGTPIEHVDANREAVEIDVSHYASGIYFIHVSQMKNHYYTKLIIQH